MLITMVTYEDSLYGPVQIEEPVLLELMQTAAVQRLRGVLQHGISGLIGITSPVTRFDHSMGAMLLVRRLNGSVAEQIAALLHDVSHTAFSHVIDYVFGGHDSQSYHDQVKESYLAGTDVPAALARRGYDWRVFLREEDFPLLEQPAPALCADRLDYSLRDSLELGLATAADVQFLLDHLVTHNGRMALNHLGAARWLANTYLAADDASWANFREVGIYELAARAIRAGLDLGAIDESDLWGTDAVAWAKLQAHPDPDLQRQLALVSAETTFVWDEAQPTFRVSTKLRTLDPDVLTADGLRPLSALDTAFAGRRHDYLRRRQGKWPMRVIPPVAGRPDELLDNPVNPALN
jgi:uncharacterized protein